MGRVTEIEDSHHYATGRVTKTHRRHVGFRRDGGIAVIDPAEAGNLDRRCIT